jgi:hypothetical protein
VANSFPVPYCSGLWKDQHRFKEKGTGQTATLLGV